MDIIRRETRFVTGVSQELGGSGDPSAATAYGVLWAMKAVARRLWGETTLADAHVAVSGVGKVGTHLVRHLVEERARVTVADVDAEAVARVVNDYDVESVEVEKIHALDADIYSPCAMGGALDSTTIPELRCAAVVGSANNQLATPDGDELLHRLGVVYAPDFVVNAGGVINIASELSHRGYHPGRAYEQVRRIFDTVGTVLDAAAAEGIPTGAAADRYRRGPNPAPAARPRDPDFRVTGGGTDGQGLRRGAHRPATPHPTGTRSWAWPATRWWRCTAPSCWPAPSTSACGTSTARAGPGS